MPLPLSETIVAGASGHIADHNLIHDTANRIEGIALNALEYNVRPANSGATNRVNLATAIAAAVAQARPLYIPPGNYTLTYDVANPSILTGGNLRIFGAGRALTILTINPTVMTFVNLRVLDHSTVGELHISDLTVQGPTAGSGNDAFDESSNFAYKRSEGNLTLENVQVKGNLAGPFTYTKQAFDVTIRVLDCKLTGYGSAGGAFEGTFAQTKCVFIVDNCEIHDIQALSTSGPPEPDNVGFYIHPHFEVHVSNSVFRNIPRWGVYLNGTGGTAKCKGVFVTNCSFIDCKAIQFSSDGPGLASNILMHNSEIMCRSHDVTLNNVVGTGSVFNIGAGLGGAEVHHNFSNFNVDLTDATSDSLGLALSNVNSCKYTLRNINIRNTSASPNGYGIIAGSTSAGTSVHDWDGVTISGDLAQPINIRSLDKASIRNLKVDRASGTSESVRFEYSQNEVEINGLHITGAGTAKGVRLDAATTANKVIGRDWRFTGSASPPIELLTAGQQRVERRRGVAPTAIASAATLNMYDNNEKCSYDTFRISGTTTINTITPGPFSGKLTLIATGAWSTSAAGNIKAKVGTARTVDRAYTFYFNPDTALWYELDDLSAAGGVTAHDLRGDSHTDALKPGVALTETIARSSRPYLANVNLLASGRMHLTAIYLPTGTTITSITYLSSGTALVTGTNQWFALYNSALGLLRQTVDDTSTAWLASAFKTLALTSTFLTTYSGLHYLGLMVAATTVPSIACTATLTSIEKIQGLSPIDNGSSTTGLTTTAPATASLSANASSVPYAYVS